MMTIALAFLAAAASPCHDSGAVRPAKSASHPPFNVRCVEDAFGNYTCTDGSRMLRDKNNGNITVIRGRPRQ